MNFLSRAWKDISEGENVDVYITLTGAIIITALNVLGVITFDIAPLVLAILALLSFTTINNRHRLDRIVQTVQSLGSSQLDQKFPEEIRQEIEGAREIWILGIHSSDVVARYYNMFSRKIQEGDKFKVLLVSPDGAACRMTTLRFPGNPDINQENLRIKSSLSSLKSLCEVNPKNMDVRTLDFMFAYGAVILNPKSPNGKAFVSQYTFRTFGGSRKPKKIYRKGDAGWFDLTIREFENMWEVATPVDDFVAEESLPTS